MTIGSCIIILASNVQIEHQAEMFQRCAIPIEVRTMVKSSEHVSGVEDWSTLRLCFM
jgi:hypothetical protein